MGSTKQIEWAGKIKAEKLCMVEAAVDAARAVAQEGDSRMAQIEIAAAKVRDQDDADWWINNRDASAAMLMRLALKIDQA